MAISKKTKTKDELDEDLQNELGKINSREERIEFLLIQILRQLKKAK